MSSSEENVTSADAVIIGSGALPRELLRNLSNRRISSVRYDKQSYLDPTLAPEFLFWFPSTAQEEPSEMLLNFSSSLHARLIIVGCDSLEYAPLLQRCIDRDIDARLAIVCDLYGHLVRESMIAPIWSSLPLSVPTLPDAADIAVFPLYIEDAAEALCLIALSSQAYNKTMVLAGDQAIRISDFVQLVLDEVRRQKGSSPELRSWDQPPALTWAHADKTTRRDDAYRLLGWRPSTSLSNGLTHTVAEQDADQQMNPQPATSASREEPKKKIEPTDTKPTVAISLPAPSVPRLLEPPAPQPSLPKSEPPMPPFLAPEIPAARREETHHKFKVAIALVIAFFLLIISILFSSVLTQRMARQLSNDIREARDLRSTEEMRRAMQSFARVRDLKDTLSLITSPLWNLLGLSWINEQQSLVMSQLTVENDVNLLTGSLSDDVLSLAREMDGANNDHPSVILSRIETTSSSALSRLGALVQIAGEDRSMDELRKKIALGRELLPTARWLLGIDGKRTVLVVLQDSTEIRPSGGVPAVLAFVTIEKARVLDVSFVEIDDVDAQLVGVEQSPDPIRRLTGEDIWRARDANWSPDGPQAAAQMTRVVSRSLGRSVDAVIFVTSEALRSVLASTGSVYDTDGQEISSLNIADRLAFTNESNSGKGRYLTMVAVANGLRGFLAGPMNNALISGVIDALDRQEIFMTVNDPSLTDTLSLLNLDGGVADSTCPLQFRSTSCYVDSVSVVDANFSVNHSDHFMVREHELLLSLEPDASPTLSLRLRYRNTAGNEGQEVSYHGYARVLLPLDVDVKAVVVEHPDGSETPVSVDHDVLFGKRVEGFYVHVTPQNDLVIRLDATRGTPFTFDQEMGGYNLLLQKQPGIASLVTNITVGFDPTMTPVGVWPETVVKDRSLLFTLKGDRTTNIAIEFASVL